MPETEIPVHERTILVGGHTYVQKVQYTYDERKGRNTTRVLESHPLHPLYRRPSPPPADYETFPCTPVQFGLLATHLMNGTLTAENARHLVEAMGVKVPSGTLHALGIRVELGEKTTFGFLLWRSPRSSPPGPARSVRRRSPSSTRTARPGSSRSRAGSA